MSFTERRNQKLNTANDIPEQSLAVVYLRSATNEPRVTDRQKELCERFAEKNDMKIISYIEDIAKSGMYKDQNDLIRRIQTIKVSISFLIVSSFDRISRNTATTMHCIEQLKQFGIETISVTEDSPKMDMFSLDNEHIKE